MHKLNLLRSPLDSHEKRDVILSDNSAFECLNFEICLLKQPVNLSVYFVDNKTQIFGVRDKIKGIDINN